MKEEGEAESDGSVGRVETVSIGRLLHVHTERSSEVRAQS